jgi:S-formylglutathione hydrolase FrmB
VNAARPGGDTAWPWGRTWSGRLEEVWIESPALRGNRLGDPFRRPLWVYLPPGYDDEPGRRYPAIYVLQGYLGQVDMWRNRVALWPTFPEMLDALFAGDEAPAPPPCIVVLVDAWTSLGGSQFLDSPATGRYHSYLCQDVVPWVDARYRTLAAREHRGVTGHSSGGYGAMVSAMLRPDLFAGLASHAGDALFELCYLPEFPMAVRALRDGYDGSYERFWRDFRSRLPFTRPYDQTLFEVYAMAACYSAEPDGTVLLPFEPATGRLVPEVWERWLAWDPVRMAPRHAAALRSLRAVYLDAGRSDDYYLDLGAEAVRRQLVAAGVTEIAFELFEGGHGRIAYRYPLAIRYLAERLAPRS